METCEREMTRARWKSRVEFAGEGWGKGFANIHFLDVKAYVGGLDELATILTEEKNL